MSPEQGVPSGQRVDLIVSLVCKVYTAVGIHFMVVNLRIREHPSPPPRCPESYIRPPLSLEVCRRRAVAGIAVSSGPYPGLCTLNRYLRKEGR